MKIKGESGNYYEVTKYSCTCPHYVYRMAKVGGVCKHIAQAFYHVTPTTEPKQNDLKELLNNPIDTLTLIDCVGFDEFTQLRDSGVIVATEDVLYRKVWMMKND